MGISIYYTAKRVQPLTEEERAAVGEIVERFSIEKEIDEYIATGRGRNWSSFDDGITEETEDGVVLNGSTRLPDNDEDALWVGVQHWCALLTQIRRAVKGAEWNVAVEDHAIFWDEKRVCYDPRQ